MARFFKSRRTWFAIMLMLLGSIASVMICSPNRAWAQNKGSIPLTHSQNDVLPYQELLKNVKAAHIFVCLSTNNVILPDWLQYDALVNTAIRYTQRGAVPVSYSDGQWHRPDVLPCEKQEDSVTGDLNIVLKLTAHEKGILWWRSAVVVLQRSLSRPDNTGFIFQSEPLTLNLSYQTKAQQEFAHWNTNCGDSKNGKDAADMGGVGFHTR